METHIRKRVPCPYCQLEFIAHLYLTQHEQYDAVVCSYQHYKTNIEHGCLRPFIIFTKTTYKHTIIKADYKE